jgi:thermitase
MDHFVAGMFGPRDEPPWVGVSRSAGGTVRFVADEVLVLRDHVAVAHQVLNAAGHRRTEVMEDELPGGFRRLRAPGLNVGRVVGQLRSHAREAGDTRVVAGANHIFAAAPLEHAGPYGAPRAAAPARLRPRDESAAAVEVLVIDDAPWPDSPLPTERYAAAAEDMPLASDRLDDRAVAAGDVGHGNFVAGILLRRSGLVRPRLVRVLDSYGICRESDLAAVLADAAGSPIVNLSLGGYTLADEPPMLLKAALDRLLSDDRTVVVAAAGNDGAVDRPFWPAAFAGAAVPWKDRVVAVTAHDGQRVCAWSNTGPWVTLAAPGENITSTLVRHTAFADGWAQWSGTSFAAAYVAAAIADAFAETGSAPLAAAAVVASAAQTYGSYPAIA